MQTRNVLLALAAATSAASASALLAGCKTTDCGSGTTEQDGTCVPANVAYGNEMCGPFTELHGGQCEPMYPPTVCGPGTLPTTGDDGVATCLPDGTAGGCSAPIACPAPTDGTQTICGQLYDFETGAAFAAADATGAACTTPTATGPCALKIKAFNALTLLSSGAGEITPGSTTIDDCGRYKLAEVPVSGVQFVALNIDDASDAMKGPAGVTNAVGVATIAAANTATKSLEAFIIKASTSTGWGIDYSTKGLYAAVYRGHSTGTDPAVGVQLLVGSMTTQGPGDTKYFQAGSTNRTTIDGAATATTTNGTALIVPPMAGPAYYTGSGAIPASCAWQLVPGGSIAGAIFVQIFRPTNAPGQTCTL